MHFYGNIFNLFSWLVSQCELNYKMYMESTARVNSHEGGVAEKKRVSSRDAGPEWRREMREKGAYSLTVVHLGYGIMCAAASAPGIHRTHVPRRGGRRKACAEPRRWARMVPQTPTRRQWFRCRQMCESSCRRSGRYPRRLGSCYCSCLHGPATEPHSI